MLGHVTDVLDYVTAFEYDMMDRVTRTTDPMGHPVTFLYNAKGQLVGTANADGTTLYYSYDATGEGTNWWTQSVKKCVYFDYVHTDRLGSEVKPGGRWGRGATSNGG